MAYSVEPVLRRLGIAATRRGRRWWARCPRADIRQFHPRGDLNASWMIWGNEVPHKAGLHRCFSCKFAGNLPHLVIHVLGLKDDFASKATEKAVAWLRGEIAPEAPISKVKIIVLPERKKLFVLPPEVVVEPVVKWPTPMRRYVLDTRGMTPEQVDRWGFGYAVDGRLSGRIVIVTRDRHGLPVNYSARAIGALPKRYLMADSREGPDRRVLFGEQFWPTAGRPAVDGSSVVVLTEGAFNALAIERVMPGVAVAALSGSHVSPSMVARLATFSHLIVATDSDTAGRQAAASIDAAFSKSADVRHVVFPIGEDANSLPPDQLRSLLSAVWPKLAVS